MGIDNGKNSRPYLVVGCSYHCFPFVHQMFCEPGVIGRGARLRLIIFSPQSARHLQTSAKLFSLPICNPSATHCHFSWSSSRHGRRWTRLIYWTVTISATCRSQDSSPIFLLSPPTKSPTGPLPRNFPRHHAFDIIFLCCHQVASSEQTHGNHLQILRDVLRQHTTHSEETLDADDSAGAISVPVLMLVLLLVLLN